MPVTKPVNALRNTFNSLSNEPVTKLKQLVNNQEGLTVIVADLRELETAGQLSTTEKIETLILQNKNIIARANDDQIQRNVEVNPQAIDVHQATKKINQLTELKALIDANRNLIKTVHELRQTDEEKTNKRIQRSGFSNGVNELVDLLTEESPSADAFIGKKEKFERDIALTDMDNSVAVTREHAYEGSEVPLKGYSAEAKQQAFRDFERDAVLFLDGKQVQKPDRGSSDEEKKKAFEKFYDSLNDGLIADGLSEPERADFFMEISQAGVAGISAQFRVEYTNNPHILAHFEKNHKQSDLFSLMTQDGGGTKVFIDTKEKTVTTEFVSNRGVIGYEPFAGQFKGTRIYNYMDGFTLTTIDQAILQSNQTQEEIDIHPHALQRLS